ncbi:MAG: hypothetical protein HWE39_02030 [Oceanospirillaceae bacterium]|nr:hypothetical protein [Oceanospirillaceae bacterium]
MPSFRLFSFRLWLLSLALFGCVLQVQANPGLTSQQVAGYVSLLPDVRAFSQRLGTELGTELQRELQPTEGEAFAPHSKGLAMLKQRQPDNYRSLSQLVESGGFPSAEAWASAGDRVMLGYAALKAEQASPELLAMAAGMDPQMLALMPPAMQARVKQVQLLARTLAAVDPADMAVVRPLVPQLDTYWRQDWQRIQP